MDITAHHFKDITILITHYNRSSSLERLLKAFRDINCTFEDIVVSDDASEPEHLTKIAALNHEYLFRLISAKKNSGLGNNINKGQDAVKTPYTLYVQEDFVPTAAFAENFKNAYEIIKENQSLDIIRFYAYFKYPYLKPLKNGFSEMIFKPWHPGYMKFYYYSDHPHLRRSDFLNKFGRYAEGMNVDKTEYRMCISFIQKKGKGLFFDKFNTLFLQINSSEEPSTALYRPNWRARENLFILFLRSLYLQIKYIKCHLDLVFMK